jgi:hypothetical protein
MYAWQLKSLARHYSPSKVLIVFQEHMRRDMPLALGRVQRFLGVPVHDLDLTRGAESASAGEAGYEQEGEEEEGEEEERAAALPLVGQVLRLVPKAAKALWSLCQHSVRWAVGSRKTRPASASDSQEGSASRGSLLLQSLTPATKQGLDAAFREANAELLQLLQALPFEGLEEAKAGMPSWLLQAK